VDGALTPVEKLEVHRRGLRHKAISVFLLRGREVLLQRRALGKYHTPGLWTNTCCTHPHWDEPPAVCAARRLEEELGIAGTHPIHRHSLEYRAELPNGLIEHEVVEVFLVRATAPVTVRPDPDEVMETRWADYHDLLAEVARHPDRFTPWIRIYLADHAAEIFGPELVHATQGN
jgi:isopentenyl-diphosphate delta-isomerase